MLIIEKKAKLKWNSANRKKYVDLGYEFTAWKEEFYVEIKDITKTTRAIVVMKCDYCESEREMCFKNYNHILDKSETKKDTCGEVECVSKKKAESNLIIYGHISPNGNSKIQKKKVKTIKEKYGEEFVSVTQVPEIKEKGRITNLENYGTEYAASSEEVRNKIKETNLKKFGSEYYMGTEEFYEKSKITNLKLYGSEYASQSDIIKEKVTKTNLERYGTEYSLQNTEVRLKGIETSLRKYGYEYYTQTPEYRETFSGEGNGNWNPELTQEDRDSRYDRGSEQVAWRKAVYKKDGYTCQCCSAKGVYLNAHHIDGYNWCIERRTDVSNGVTLCEDCHLKYHSEYGYKNSTEEQFNEFLIKYKIERSA